MVGATAQVGTGPQLQGRVEGGDGSATSGPVPVKPERAILEAEASPLPIRQRAPVKAVQISLCMGEMQAGPWTEGGHERRIPHPSQKGVQIAVFVNGKGMAIRKGKRVDRMAPQSRHGVGNKRPGRYGLRQKGWG